MVGWRTFHPYLLMWSRFHMIQRWIWPHQNQNKILSPRGLNEQDWGLSLVISIHFSIKKHQICWRLLAVHQIRRERKLVFRERNQIWFQNQQIYINNRQICWFQQRISDLEAEIYKKEKEIIRSEFSLTHSSVCVLGVLQIVKSAKSANLVSIRTKVQNICKIGESADSPVRANLQVRPTIWANLQVCPTIWANLQVRPTTCKPANLPPLNTFLHQQFCTNNFFQIYNPTLTTSL